MYEEAILAWFSKPLYAGDCVKFKGQLKGFTVRARQMRGGERKGATGSSSVIIFSPVISDRTCAAHFTSAR